MRLDYEESAYSGGESWAQDEPAHLSDAIRRLPSTDTGLVRRYGGPVSHGALNPSYRTFRTPEIDGLVGYRLDHRCAVALGDPICAPEQRAQLAAAFSTYCAANGWSVIYAVATESMGSVAKVSGYGMIEFAEFLIANPQRDPELGSENRKLRWNLNRTRRQGVTVREYLGNQTPNGETEARVLAAMEQWRTGRKGVQMYLGSPRLFADRPGCRWFIAEWNGAVVGVLYLLQVDCGGCRYMIDLVFSTPGAPSHTNELMVVNALRSLREEGEEAVSFGVGPKAALGEIQGFSAISVNLARGFYQLANRMVPQDGKTVFWQKFGLSRREPLYLLFEQPRVGIREFRALLKTFNFSL
jgi:lysylphosphatidylglycerol synthetase-like protein (DUF2156 family)